MCTLLIKAVDANHSDPIIDRRGCYKKDDVVVVMPDGHNWGLGELDTAVFYIVDMLGVPVSNFESSVYETEDFINKVGASGIGVFRHQEFKREKLKVTRRRKYKFNTVTQQIEGKH